jgi:uncharacterized protein (TIGR02145 family)
MKSKLKNRISLIVVCASFLVLAVSCKKEGDNPDTITDIDGNVYNTVTIGTQVWFDENLKTTKYNDATDIPYVTDAATWDGLSTPAYCWHENDISNKNTYGALYNWYAVNTAKLCPAGWHVATNDDWDTLVDYIGGAADGGGKLKSTRTAPDAHPRWDSPNTGATDEYNFKALPEGGRSTDGHFVTKGKYGTWWSANEWTTSGAYLRDMYADQSNIFSGGSNKEHGFSVRCIKD